MNEFATGTWIYGTVGDRYLLDGYRRGLEIRERIERISRIEGIAGIEMIYPADFGPGVERLGGWLGEAGLECCVVGVDLTGDPRWRFGTYSSRDPKLRAEALALTRETVDAALALGAGRVNVWPGEDGHDYPFQVDYNESWNRFRDCLAEVASYRPGVKICLEYKLREPRARSLIDTASRSVLMCRDVGAENLGVTIDVGHALQAGENISDSLSLLAREGRLFHVHLNDNYRSWDDDMVVGSVHLVEFLEMLFTLRKVSFEGWLSVDVYPYREDPAAVVAESVAFVRSLDGVIDRIGVGVIEEALEQDDPIPLLSGIRRAVLG